ncbi:hypothetical protein FHW88_002785 [Mucilaginibacter sp. SG538B]|uniref:hypothetical protein n=1 Tax=Mucilaginibacter sp. SG538B TaxID=2587021 RepID=UPI00159E54D6|nr:hypothetical protein [Mucilaginibacter sp. SG538B]NVM64496.1 hypothetical protein [Mucilaginibacter sp. SG538B]
MPNKFIQLSKKLSVSSEEEAKAFGLNEWYNAYFDEQRYQIDSLRRFRYILNKHDKAQLNEDLKQTFGSRFARQIASDFRFLDLNDRELEIKEVDINADSFAPANNIDILNIYIVSQPIELIQSFGSILLAKLPDTEILLNIELNKETTIYSYK